MTIANTVNEIIQEKVIYTPGTTHIETVVKNGICAYTKKPASDFLKEHPGSVVISFEHALKLIAEAEDLIYQKPWREISEEKYWDALECLPPEKWETCNGVTFFRSMEYETGLITAHYAKTEGKYYFALRRVCSSYDKLTKEIQKQLATNTIIGE